MSVEPGALFAVDEWLIASLLFAADVAGFASYNKTYGALAGVVVFLIWLWITTIALLIGAELDSGSGCGCCHPAAEQAYALTAPNDPQQGRRPARGRGPGGLLDQVGDGRGDRGHVGERPGGDRR